MHAANGAAFGATFALPGRSCRAAARQAVTAAMAENFGFWPLGG